jgi:phosphoglycerol transferase MdoB-like AlkP superfamily enzyme
MIHLPNSLSFFFRTALPRTESGKTPCRTVQLCCLFLTLLLLPVIMQFLHLLDVPEVLAWLKIFHGPLQVNILIITLLFLFFYAVFNSLSYGMAMLLLFCGLFSIADMQKMRILHQPLLPGDLIFFKQALLVTRMYSTGIVLGVLLIVVLVSGLLLFRKQLVHLRLPWRARIVAGALLCGSLLCIATNLRGVIPRVNQHYRIVNEFWNQLSNYHKNGVLYAFLMNLESLHVDKPEQYSKKNVDALLQPFVVMPDEDTSKPKPVYPDVILYMNESFWDLTRIESVPLPCDPIPCFRSLSRGKRSLTLYSPVFGGNTCDAEFEVLTGMTCRFFPEGVRAYNQFIQRPVPSLVRLFKANGYRTTAVHTFKRWFWNRGNVYRHLGFDHFISMEDMKDPEIKGMYISDAELSRRIIARLDSGGGPQFIFALSMQNHGPYDEERYDSLDCRVATGLSDAADREYNTYLQGITDADRSLLQLTRYIRKVSRPTLLLFSGDHLPGFTHVYRESGYEKPVRDGQPWAFASRGVWFANFPLAPQQDTAISMYYLPLAVARQAHLTLPPWYRFLDSLRTRTPVRIRKQHSARHPEMEERSPEWLLIYDVLFGKGYSQRYQQVTKPVRNSGESTDTLPVDSQ